MPTFAQLGSVIFEPVNGFNSYEETESAVIAQYELVGQKAYPIVTGYGLRQITVTLRLHQRFIIVAVARAQLTGYMQHGDIVALTWGTGEVEGTFFIQQIQTSFEEMDPLGNVMCCSLSVQLLEAPDEALYSNAQRSAMNNAFATGENGYAPVPGVVVPELPPDSWELWTAIAGDAIVLGAMISALAYGGKFPQLGYSMAGLIGSAASNMTALQTNYATYGSGYDIPDVSGYIRDAITCLGSLATYAADGDWYNFGLQNVIYQGKLVDIFF